MHTIHVRYHKSILPLFNSQMGIDASISCRASKIFILAVRNVLSGTIVSKLLSETEINYEKLKNESQVMRFPNVIWKNRCNDGSGNAMDNCSKILVLKFIFSMSWTRYSFTDFNSITQKLLHYSTALANSLTLLQCRPMPIRKLSGFMSLCIKFLLWTYSIRLIICNNITMSIILWLLDRDYYSICKLYAVWL